MSDHDPGNHTKPYLVHVCEACRTGREGECHRPGCLFIRQRTPQPEWGTWEELLMPYAFENAPQSSTTVTVSPTSYHTQRDGVELRGWIGESASGGECMLLVHRVYHLGEELEDLDLRPEPERWDFESDDAAVRLAAAAIRDKGVDEGVALVAAGAVVEALRVRDRPWEGDGPMVEEAGGTTLSFFGRGAWRYAEWETGLGWFVGATPANKYRPTFWRPAPPDPT